MPLALIVVAALGARFVGGERDLPGAIVVAIADVAGAGIGDDVRGGGAGERDRPAAGRADREVIAITEGRAGGRGGHGVVAGAGRELGGNARRLEMADLSAD